MHLGPSPFCEYIYIHICRPPMGCITGVICKEMKTQFISLDEVRATCRKHSRFLSGYNKTRELQKVDLLIQPKQTNKKKCKQ